MLVVILCMNYQLKWYIFHYTLLPLLKYLVVKVKVHRKRRKSGSLCKHVSLHEHI